MSSTKLYLQPLPQNVTQEEVRKYLSIYGEITEVTIRSGYGLVQFASEKDAMDVASVFSRRQFLGADVKLEPLRGNSTDSNTTPPRHRSTFEHERIQYPVVIMNLNYKACWQELKEFGRLAGSTVDFCHVRKTEGKAVGFINYSIKQDAERAVQQLNGKVLLGRSVEVIPYTVYLHRRRSEGPAGYTRPRSRSPQSRRSIDRAKRCPDERRELYPYRNGRYMRPVNAEAPRHRYGSRLSNASDPCHHRSVDADHMQLKNMVTSGE